jgi:hypothetical protein
MEQTAGIFIVLIIFASITGVILGVIYLRNRSRERMHVIEKGADPSILKSELTKGSKLPIKIGIFLIGIALGIILGNIIANYTYIFPENEVAYFASIFLFGGISLLISQLVGNNK